MNLQLTIENIWNNRELLKEEASQQTIREVIEQLDKGKLRVAEPTANGWQVNEWVKKAVILYFPIQKMETLHAGPMEFYDKMKLKTNYLINFSKDSINFLSISYKIQIII